MTVMTATSPDDCTAVFGQMIEAGRRIVRKHCGVNRAAAREYGHEAGLIGAAGGLTEDQTLDYAERIFIAVADEYQASGGLH